MVILISLYFKYLFKFKIYFSYFLKLYFSYFLNISHSQFINYLKHILWGQILIKLFHVDLIISHN